MNIIQPGQGTKAYEKDSVTAKKLLSKPEVEAVRVELGPGGSLPAHTTPVDVFFFIIRGTGEVEIGTERETVSAGSLIESPKDIIHGLHNTSEEVFEVLVVKTPKP